MSHVPFSVRRSVLINEFSCHLFVFTFQEKLYHIYSIQADFHTIGQPVAAPDPAGWLNAPSWRLFPTTSGVTWSSGQWCHSEWLPSSRLSGSLGQESTQCLRNIHHVQKPQAASSSGVRVVHWWERSLFEKAIMTALHRMWLKVSVTNYLTLHLRCTSAVPCRNSPPTTLLPVLERGWVSALLLGCLFQDSCWQLNWTWEVLTLTVKDLCSPSWQAVAFPHLSGMDRSGSALCWFSSMLNLASPNVWRDYHLTALVVNLLICQHGDPTAKVLLAHRNHSPQTAGLSRGMINSSAPSPAAASNKIYCDT